jgi:acetylornithine deacetylase
MKAIRYAKRLIGFDTVSHRSNRLISKYLEMKLIKHGFIVEKIEYLDESSVRKTNLIAKKGGGAGGLAYCAHSDVVPAKQWFSRKHGPFDPFIANDRLYGRGACDMKGSIACMLAAAQNFAWNDLQQPLYFIVTADEEIGFGGAKCVVRESKLFREMVESGTRAVIGEPTSLDVVHAHKGSVEIRATALGTAGHSAMGKSDNANLRMIPFLTEMKRLYDLTESEPEWQNSEFDPPTLSWNIRVKDDSPALNVTASRSECTMYLRTMPNVDENPILAQIEQAARQHNIQLNIDRRGFVFYADPQSELVQESLKMLHRQRPLTVAYGTDAGIFSEIEQKIICGPGSILQAHTVDEWISLEQLSLGTEMYAKMIRRWCCQSNS